VFGDDVLASAILDRLLHHCEVISISGPSYRLKDRLKSSNGGGPWSDMLALLPTMSPYLKRHQHLTPDTSSTEHPSREGRPTAPWSWTCSRVGWSIDTAPTAAARSAWPSSPAPHRPARLSTRPGGAALVPSMGSVGDCYDNAMIEAFWSRMQVELLDRRRWTTRMEPANAIFEYLEIFPTARGDTARWAC
jgi:IstB-like ATP binding protein